MVCLDAVECYLFYVLLLVHLFMLKKFLARF